MTMNDDFDPNAFQVALDAMISYALPNWISYQEQMTASDEGILKDAIRDHGMLALHVPQRSGKSEFIRNYVGRGVFLVDCNDAFSYQRNADELVDELYVAILVHRQRMDLPYIPLLVVFNG